MHSSAPKDSEQATAHDVSLIDNSLKIGTARGPAARTPRRSAQPPSSRANRFRTRRRAVQLAIVVLLVSAPFFNILRFDLVEGVFVLFGMRLGLGTDLWLVYCVALIGLLWIFGGALIHGRFWCGWICPQTLMSEWANWLETTIRGRSPAKRKRAGRLVLYLLAVGAISALIAVSAVTYFLTPAQRFVPPVAAWVGFGVLTLMLIANLLWLRHRFCLRACPYGVLLQLIQDPKTLRVELDESNRAACINCRACERVCFMDVNVRDPDRRFENACLLCGLCIDACENVLSRRGGESLIHLHFRQENAGWPNWLSRLGISDVRRLGLSLVVAAAVATFGLMLVARRDFDAALTPRFDQQSFSSADAGTHRTYSLVLTNRTNSAQWVHLDARGLEGIRVREPEAVEIEARDKRRVRVVLSLPASSPTTSGGYPIVLTLRDETGGVLRELNTRFFVPEDATR